MDDGEIIREFLIETNENLDRLGRELVLLARRPKDAALLAGIFRVVHTLKGTCRFLGFTAIEAVTHHAETILGQVRSGERDLTPELVSLISESVDAVKRELAVITRTGKESGGRPERDRRLNPMQPIGVIWKMLPRIVRDLSARCGKQVILEMDGAETAIDRSIIKAIKEPLTHIVRNACDHGIEAPEARIRAGKAAHGRLTLRAFHEGGAVIVEIADDGNGIDYERVRAVAVARGLIGAQGMSERQLTNLVFLPGFSTAREVMSISGRGVGMDVVKTNMEEIGGTAGLTSRSGVGTTIRLRIPDSAVRSEPLGPAVLRNLRRLAPLPSRRGKSVRVLILGADIAADEVAACLTLSCFPAALPEFRIAGVWARDKQKAGRFACRFGVPGFSVREAAHSLNYIDAVVSTCQDGVSLLSERVLSPLLESRVGPLLVLDLGVPRNLEPVLAQRDGLHVVFLGEQYGHSASN